MHRVVIALVTLIGLTGVAVVGAYLFLFSASTDRAAGLAPARTAFYTNLYLQPSTGQQMNLAGLIGRFPGFADEASLDDKVDQITQNLLTGTGVDYRTQVKPWLGDQLAVAAWPGSNDPAEGDAVLIAEVNDREAAAAAVADIAAEGGASFATETYSGIELQVGDGTAYALVADMLVVGTAADAVHAVIDVQDGADSLAARADFRATMDDLPPDHLASVFIDLAAVAEATDVADQFGSMTTASAVLVAERDGLRLSGSAPLQEQDAGPSASERQDPAGEPSSLVEWMPEGTLAEVVLFGLRQTLEDAEAAATTTPEGQEITSALDTLRGIAAFGLGIDIDADILPLLDREVAIALTAYDEPLPSGQLLLRPDDPAAAEDALDRVAERLTAIGATRTDDEVDGNSITTLTIPELGEVAYAIVDDEVVVLALGRDDVLSAIEAHASGESLRNSAAYEETFAVAGIRAGTEAYVDVGALVDVMGGEIELPDDARDILLQIGSLGLTVPSRDDHIEFHMVLTVDEP